MCCTMMPSSASLRCDMSACGSLRWLRVSGKEHRCRCHLSTLHSSGTAMFSAQRGTSLTLIGVTLAVRCSCEGQLALAEQFCMLPQLLRLVGVRCLEVILALLLRQIEHVADALHTDHCLSVNKYILRDDCCTSCARTNAIQPRDPGPVSIPN